MADNAGDTPDEPPLTDAEKKLKEDSQFNKQWIDQLKKKNQQDGDINRPPLNRDNIGRIFTDKPKTPEGDHS